MPSSVERDASRDGERHLRHQHSASSDQGRALIPMWDSSDPERAPPPLPLNPQSPSVSPRKGTSSAIQSAHASLAERAGENSGNAGHMVKRQADMSSDKSLVKSSHHRRMQSLQTGTVRDLSMLLEGGQLLVPLSPTKSPDKSLRPSTPAASSEGGDSRQAERELPLPSPVPGPSLTPIVRPTVRRPQQSILGENTPPQSATMLALQNTPTQLPRDLPEAPLPNVSNSSHALVKSAPNIDGLSNQILSLTNIATALQKDIAQLSRRSRDNATDLLSLKEATNARDEDIRRSLREVITNFNDSPRPGSRDPGDTGLLLDNKPHLQHGSSPLAQSKSARPFSLPRIPSPNSFASSIDREVLSTPSLCSHDSSGSIAILERILKDMGTKQGHELLLGRLSQLAEKIAGLASAAKVDELITMARKSAEQALVPHAARSLSQESNNGQQGLMTQRVEMLLRNENGRRSSTHSASAPDVLNDDFIKMIRSIKDSLSQSGGMTAEVKALVRELRGEVLGMGREIGRRLEHANNNEEGPRGKSREEMSRIVDEGLEQMKGQMDDLIQAYHQQLTALASTPSIEVDYQEIYNAMRAALRDSQKSGAQKASEPSLIREDIISAVRVAWEEYKPEVETVNHGLDKEEVLEYLKEGLCDHARADEGMPGATREEVFQAVVEGLKHFVPPRMDSAASLSRDEILDAVRECLEEFEFPVAPSAINAELTRDDMVHAVKEGLDGFDFPQSSSQHAAIVSSTDIATRLEELMTFMQQEFRTVSEEAKQNMAANGRDTEQVLDATKDGLEKLRVDLEDCIQEATNRLPSTAQSELLSPFSNLLDNFRDDITELLAKSTDDSKAIIESRLDSLHETVNSSMVPVTPQGGHAEILEALKNGLDSLRAEIHRPLAGTAEVLDALHEGLADLRISIEKVGNKPMDLTANDEILDALKAGLDGVRSDIDGLREESREVKAVTTLNDNAVVPAGPNDTLRHDDIKNLEVLITQLRIKVEALSPEVEQASSSVGVSKDDLSRLEDMLEHVAESVNGITGERAAPRAAPETASREDVEAIETILRNTKAKLDDLIDGDQAVRKDQLDILQALLDETRGAVENITTQLGDLPVRADLAAVEATVALVSNGLDEMKEQTTKGLEDPERVTKTNVEAIEAICRDIKTVLDENLRADLAALASEEDVQNLGANLEEIKEQLNAVNELTNAAFEERQAEIVGVGERVSDVKVILEELRQAAMSKLDNGATSLEALGKLLENISEITTQNSTVGQDLKQLSDAMKAEFEESKASMVGAKMDADEKLQQATDCLSAKIDERITELLTKYDEFQSSADERAKAGEARDLETEQAILGAKSVADELKSLVDTLGSAVTDSLEKMEEASKTVFNKVEELMVRTEENHVDGKSEHHQTRDQVKLAINAVEGLQGQIGENQPQILEAIKDVLLVVGQHYEHSKSSTAEIENKIITTQMKAEPPLLPPIERYDDTSMQEKLDRLMSQKFDDTSMHEKLDKLVGHTVSAEKAFAQLHTLDQLHQQVLQNASEISTFLSDQRKELTEATEDKEKILQELNLALERQTSQKEQIEASLLNLREEEDALKQSILGMKEEQEMMNRQKTKLTADVSSLETALRLRREELQDMEVRAEGLERRILEGVMDHSRVLLMSKAAKNQEAMSRKRVKMQKPPRNAESSDQPTQTTVPIALSAKRNLAPPSQTPPARRILSLSQISNNAVSSGVKRSQSVRTPAARSFRKSSWAGGPNRNGDGPGKENVSVRGIDEEPETEGHDSHDDHDSGALIVSLPTIESSAVNHDGRSQEEILRRSSHGTTIITEDIADSMISDDDHGMDPDFADGENGRSLQTDIEARG